MDSPKRILVVEDDVFLTKIYKAKMEKAGFIVDLAGNGEEALAKVAAQQPDLILLDLIMPVMDGFVTLEKLKSNKKTSIIPVIITSNLGQAEDIQRGLGLGATDFIVKSDTALESVIGKMNAILQAKPV
jgi:CheY-like chemotaxis protein